MAVRILGSLLPDELLAMIMGFLEFHNEDDPDADEDEDEDDPDADDADEDEDDPDADEDEGDDAPSASAPTARAMFHALTLQDATANPTPSSWRSIVFAQWLSCSMVFAKLYIGTCLIERDYRFGGLRFSHHYPVYQQPWIPMVLRKWPQLFWDNSCWSFGGLLRYSFDSWVVNDSNRQVHNCYPQDNNLFAECIAIVTDAVNTQKLTNISRVVQALVTYSPSCWDKPRPMDAILWVIQQNPTEARFLPPVSQNAALQVLTALNRITTTEDPSGTPSTSQRTGRICIDLPPRHMMTQSSLK